MGLSKCLLVIILFAGFHSSAQISFPTPKVNGEFNGPFPSWLNVKTGFGAKGDGHTDDTRALQAALMEVAKGSKYNTMYLPAGVYLVSKTLLLDYQINISVIGADPVKTVIKWVGQPQGTMLRLNGVAYSKFDRITFDGNSLADVAVEQSWDGNHPFFDTGNEYADDIFTDVGFGIHGGHLGHGFAETTILRDRFIRNSKAGISLGNFNALDIWIRNCLFEGCAVGVTNSFGAGNFKVYQCLFCHSSQSDLSMGNTGEFSIRGNTSIGSARFFSAQYTRNPACILIEGNTIIDPLKNPVISVGNQGPVIFTHNVIRSPAGASGHVATFSSDCLCYGNTFTVDDPIDPGDRGVGYDNRVVTKAQLNGLAVPFPSSFEPKVNRKVFEIPVGADAALIQKIINQAAKLAGKRPVIHFPFSFYKISVTLIIPAGSDLQMVGDGFGDHHTSVLSWSGEPHGTLLRISGTCSATLKDITLKGDTGTTNLQITGADKAGSLIFLQEFHQDYGQTGIFVDHFDHGTVFAQDIGLSGLKTAVKIVGGSQNTASKTLPGQTIIYDGAESNNLVSHEVTGGGKLTVQDSWYEGNVKSIYASLSGNSTFIGMGNHIAVLPKTSALLMHDFSGEVLFAANDLTGLLTQTGKSETSRIFILGILAEDEAFLHNQAKKADVAMMNRARNYGSKLINGGSYAISDLQPDSKRVIQEFRNQVGEKQDTIDTRATISLYRVMSINGKTGLYIGGR
jgi:hypothetical protein